MARTRAAQETRETDQTEEMGETGEKRQQTLCTSSSTSQQQQQLPQHQPQQQPQQQKRQQVSRCTTITAQNMITKAQIWFNTVDSDSVLLSLHPGTGASLHSERVIAVREEPPLPLEFYQGCVADGLWFLWKGPVDVVLKSCQEVFTAVKALENQVQPVIGLGSSNEGVDHDAL